MSTLGKFSDILLTVDYDRTLTAPDATIPAVNLQAIRDFMAQGGAFTVNTGRSLPMAAQLRKIVPVNAPWLLYNGSAAYDQQADALIWQQEIPLDPWQTVAKVRALVPDLMVEVQGLQAHYRFQENPAWDAFCDFNGCAHDFAQPGQDLGPFLKFTVYSWAGSGNVGNLFQSTPEDLRRLDEAEALLRRELGESCEIFRAGARILDIHAKGVSKAKAARQLQQRLGRKILVCLGDALNDLAMLQDADYAFVPADAQLAGQFPSLCPCGQGAVADAIYKKIPEILGK